MSKRLRKLKGFDADAIGYSYDGPETTEWTLVGFGSTAAQISGGRGSPAQPGNPNRSPAAPGARILSRMRRSNGFLRSGAASWWWRNNATGQLAERIRARVGFHDKIVSCLKFSGDPFTVKEILGHVHQEEGVTA